MIEKVPEVADDMAIAVRRNVITMGEGVEKVIACAMLGALVLVAMVTIKLLQWVWYRILPRRSEEWYHLDDSDDEMLGTPYLAKYG